MGTPQMRWREMHQSGRVAIMLEMRSSPQAGSHMVGVGVLVGGDAEECAFFSEQFDDGGVGFEDGEVFVGLGYSASAVHAGVALAAGVVDVLDFGEVVAFAGVEVVDAVGG